MKKIFFIITLAILVWSCAHKIAPAKTTAATSTTSNVQIKPSTEIVQGQAIYNAKCSRCHELKTVSNYSADRWMGIMQSMAVKAHLTDVEKDNVLAYVKANAKL